MKRSFFFTVAAAVAAIQAAAADLDVAPFFVYRGRIVRAQGTSIGDPEPNFPVEVRLYANGGDAVDDALWGGAYTVMVDAEGRFQIPLGLTDGGTYGTVAFVSNLVAGASLPDVLLAGTAKYIGVKLDDGSEGYPRQKLISVPRAARAVFAESLANGATVKTAKADSVVAKTATIEAMNVSGPVTLPSGSDFAVDTATVKNGGTLKIKNSGKGLSVFKGGSPSSKSISGVSAGDTLDTPDASGVAMIVSDDWSAPGVCWFVEGGTASTSPCPVSSGKYYFFEFGTAR